MAGALRTQKANRRPHAVVFPSSIADSQAGTWDHGRPHKQRSRDILGLSLHIYLVHCDRVAVCSPEVHRHVGSYKQAPDIFHRYIKEGLVFLQVLYLQLKKKVL